MKNKELIKLSRFKKLKRIAGYNFYRKLDTSNFTIMNRIEVNTYHTCSLGICKHILHRGARTYFNMVRTIPKNNPVLIPVTNLGQEKCSCPYVYLKTWSGPVLVSSYVRAPLVFTKSCYTNYIFLIENHF